MAGLAGGDRGTLGRAVTVLCPPVHGFGAPVVRRGVSPARGRAVQGAAANLRPTAVGLPLRGASAAPAQATLLTVPFGRLAAEAALLAQSLEKLGDAAFRFGLLHLSAVALLGFILLRRR